MRYALLAAAVLASSAHAQVRNAAWAPPDASLAFADALWEVEDLAPDDGIAPLVSLTITGGLEHVESILKDAGASVFDTRFPPGANWWSGMPSRTGVYAAVVAGTPARGDVVNERSFMFLEHAVEVTPNTRVTATFDARVTRGSVAELLQIGGQTFSDSVTNGAQIRFTFDSGAAGLQGSYRETYVADATWSEGRVQALQVSPAPEPSTYALMACGLAALAWRRRARLA